jgi:hypothetical protein
MQSLQKDPSRRSLVIKYLYRHQRQGDYAAIEEAERRK